MILSAQTIRRMCEGEAPLLSPFAERTQYQCTSYGLSPAGYDLRLDLGNPAIMDHWLAPGEFLLAATLERFIMPPNVIARVHDKSTWARRGLSCYNTVIEPGWRGFLTLELINHGPNSIHLHWGAGIAQVVFERLDEPTEEPYPEYGKYQDQQAGPVGPRG